MIVRDQLPPALLDSWLASHADPDWAQVEADLEIKVSQVIGAMPFVWVPVPDHEQGVSDRSWVERNSIALLSGIPGPADEPSETWLGRRAPRMEVRTSGLWNVNHVRETYDLTFLDTLERYVV